MSRTYALLAALLLELTASIASAQPSKPTDFGDEIYRPDMGQSGKDVIWIPTPDALVTRMLQAAKTTENDVIYDLGAGDGKIPITAARDFKARAVGIEYNPDMAALARRNVQRAGVADKVKIIAGDIFESDFSEATVVTLYLLPELNLKLRPQLLKMKPGTRIVSNAFNMREWEPDGTVEADARQGFLWIVPATVAGQWEFAEGGSGWKGAVDLAQAFQRIGGSVRFDDKHVPILGATVAGTDLAFSFYAGDGTLRSIRGKVNGELFKGMLSREGYETPITGRRVTPAQRAL